MRKARLSGALMVLIAAVSTLVAPTASAADFYTPPSPLPAGQNGDLINTGPSNLAISVPGIGGPLPGKATRLMYRSQDSNDKPVAVTGTYIDPSASWTGPGERPVVAFAPGTYGQGDNCAASKLLNNLISYTPPFGVMVEYEIVQIYTLLTQGVGVVITDYQGLGTPGNHTYVNRAAEAHAVLDSVRAAKNVRGTKISPTSPVGMWGFSQGGGAVAAAAELAPQYAPELTIKGTYAGAPPADLGATLAQVDGTILFGVIGYTLNGLRDSDPDIGPIIDQYTNDKGKAMLAAVSKQCIVETALSVGFHRTNEYLKDGRSLSQTLGDIPKAQEILAKNKIGERTPNSPVYIDSGTSDDIVPHGQAVDLARDWCAKGANVTLNRQLYPAIFPGLALGHLLPDFLGLPAANKWFFDQLTNKPSGGNC
nr:lipase family protein [Rhodococcus trifolii]